MALRSPSGRPGLPHLEAACVALVAWCAVVFLLQQVSRSEVGRHVDRLGSPPLAAKSQGVVVAREALRRPDVLPIYGSSELVRPSAYRAGEFFADSPTGFVVLAVGDRGTPLLVTLQQLASVGEPLRHRKVVVFVTPSMFTRGGSAWEKSHPREARQARTVYRGNFSRLQAGELLFGAALGPELKDRAARRLLAFPDVLTDDPFLRTALQTASAGRWRRALLNPVLQLLGGIQTTVLERADDLRVLALLLGRPELRRPVRREPKTLDFSALRRTAEREYASRVRENAFGFLDRAWSDSSRIRRQRGTQSDAQYLEFLRSSPQWTDLELVFRLLRGLAANALVVSIPYPGAFMDHVGVSVQARREFYRRFEALAERYGIRAVTFEDREYDWYFLKDPYQHPSPIGWLAFDSLLTDFYHD